MASRYAQVYAGWQADPERFWAEAAGAIVDAAEERALWARYGL